MAVIISNKRKLIGVGPISEPAPVSHPPPKQKKGKKKYDPQKITHSADPICLTTSKMIPKFVFIPGKKKWAM